MNLTALPAYPLGIDPDDVSAAYRARGLDALSDERLFSLAARAVSIPKRAAADSFILHAPLELLARRALLHYVAPGRRTAVREQIVRVAAQYERAAEPVEPDARRSFASPAAARAAFA